jgi:hypothetical protein
LSNRSIATQAGPRKGPGFYLPCNNESGRPSQVGPIFYCSLGIAVLMG